MPRTSQLQLAKNQILKFFAQSPKNIFTPRRLAQLLSENRQSWRLAEKTKLPEFVSFLIKHGKLRRHDFRSERYSKEITRYSWGAADPIQLAASIKPSGYFSHGTAALLHGLIKPPQKMIYLNVEQSKKPPNDGVLAQEAINRAFTASQRQSNLIYASRGTAVTMLSGKHTNRLAVETMEGPLGQQVAATSLERTLIDIVVRPIYAGGLEKVLKAYCAAKDRMSVDLLMTTLRTLDYAYPYHQPIGFLMEKAGYPDAAVVQLRELGLKYDFYLAHGMHDPEYSEKWRLFYPHNLKSN